MFILQKRKVKLRTDQWNIGIKRKKRAINLPALYLLKKINYF